MLMILLTELKIVIDSIESLIDKLRARLEKITSRKKKLTRLEQKRRSMRALAVKIRDEDYEEGEKEEIVDRFEKLRGEAEDIEEDIN